MPVMFGCCHPLFLSIHAKWVEVVTTKTRYGRLDTVRLRKRKDQKKESTQEFSKRCGVYWHTMYTYLHIYRTKEKNNNKQMGQHNKQKSQDQVQGQPAHRKRKTYTHNIPPLPPPTHKSEPNASKTMQSKRL